MLEKPETMGTRALYVRLKADRHDKLKEAAAAEKATVTAVIQRIVDRYLADRERKERSQP